MVEAGKDLTENTTTNKRYSRIIYHCEKDDIWTTIETPEGKDTNLIYG